MRETTATVSLSDLKTIVNFAKRAIITTVHYHPELDVIERLDAKVKDLDNHEQFIAALDDIDKDIYSRWPFEVSDVSYGAYVEDENGIPVNNLDEVAFEGKCQVQQLVDSWNENEYISEVLDSPTWFELLVVAQKQSEVTRNNHHYLLAGIKPVAKVNDLTILELEMDS